MSEFMRLYKSKVDEILKPHAKIHGPDHPVVRMGLELLGAAEDIERELGERRVGTSEAAERTGWHPETLQAKAKAALGGEPLGDGWERIVVERTSGGYSFVLGTIPVKGSVAA